MVISYMPAELVITQAQQAYRAPRSFAEYVNEATGAAVSTIPTAILVDLYKDDVLRYLKDSVMQELISGIEAAYLIRPEREKRLTERVGFNECFLDLIKTPRHSIFGDTSVSVQNFSVPAEYGEKREAMVTLIAQGLVSSRFLRSLETSLLTETQVRHLANAEMASFYWFEGLVEVFSRE